MRQLTAYASYLDNLGAPLVGRARFFNMDGSEAVVYSLDNATNQYISIGSSVFTNSSGQLVPQVFLADHDYIVVFDKYIGAGTMAEDDDPESWAEQGSAVDRYNTVGIVLDGDSTRAINSISDLRQTVAVDEDGGEVVMLLGYNEQGDKPVVFYRWNDSSTEVDNGGSVIKVAGVQTGRWELTECPEYLDVRHFGAFPLQGAVADTSQRYAIQQAGLYAHSNGCGLYFNSTDVAIFYDISGLTLHDVDANPNVRLFAIQGLDAELDGIVSVHLGGNTLGTITLRNPVVRTSWEGEYNYAVLAPTETLVIDSSLRTANRNWSGIDVNIETYPGLVFLQGCRITSNKAITGAISIRGCELHTSWFSDDYSWTNLISADNTILLENCKDAATYIILKNKQSEPDYGDLNGGVLTDVDILGDSFMSNCSGSVNLTEGDKSYRFEDVSLTLNGLDTILTTSIHAIYSNIDIGGGTGGMQSLKMNGGVLSGTSLAVTSAELREVDINCSVTSTNPYGSDILEDCIVRSLMNFVNVSIIGCDVRSRIAQKGNQGVIKVKCLRNHFTVYGEHLIYSETANAIVQGEWVGNSCDRTDKHWILVDRTNLDLVDTHHSYSYVGNEQPYIDKHNGPNRAMLLRPYSGTDYTGAGVFANETHDFVFFDTGSHKVSIVPKSFDQAVWKMFSIGITEVRRSGHIESGSKFYSNVPFLGTWGTAPYFDAGVYKFSYIMGVRVNNVLQEDGTGYDWSFEQPGAVHDGHTGIGPEVGCFTDSPDNIDDTFKVWPEQPSVVWPMYLFVDKDFCSHIVAQ